MEDKGLDKLKQTLFLGMNIPLKAMPLWMEAIGVGVFISRIVEKNPRFKERLREIDGKVFLFEAKDIKKGFYLLIKDNEIKVIPHSGRKPDVTMRGTVKVLIDVLMGKEDPDTVFFSRRLEISGDTAAAIHFKNMLAALA
ncbi:MAG: SCP2 sterol-binding domain-containing protein [Deltaproteobacteria bacterium]|nr:SCP2 sterol-binding domain-containing protein [Deltaproteobacteria bacterium]